MITVLDFYADWCKPCKALAPVLEQIASELDNVTVNKINVDWEENEHLVNEYQIRNIPTLIILQKGKFPKRLVGLLPKEKILEALK